nr:septum formation family protein [Actinomycetota bacterium]
MRTRLVMAGVFVGALLPLATSMVFPWPVRVESSPEVVAEQERAAAFDSPTGSCLSWTPPEAADMKRVECAAPHLFEVTSNVDIASEYPDNAPAPDVASWQEIALAKCTPGATTYLGGTLDPFGRYTVNALKPSSAQWDDGDRKLRCGLQRTGLSGALLATTGSASRQDQSNVHEPGTCLALEEQKIGDPIDCLKAHAVEIVGTVDLSATFPGEYPTEDAQREKLIDLCAQVTAEYTGGANLAAMKLTPYPDTLKAESWAAGSRKVDCKVGAKLEDGTGLAPIFNSVGTAQPVPSSTPAVPSASPSPGG